MFAKLALQFVALSSLLVGVISTPVLYGSGSSDGLARRGNSISFNHWGGHASLDNFDRFYGVDNFDGSVHFSQVVEQESQVVCHTQAIEIIQQRLVVLQEMAKRIITEQICEVETQTIVFQQFHASFGAFNHDLRRISGHRVGFDSRIANHFSELVDERGLISTHDFGFSGLDVGKHTVVVGGHNWDDFRSPYTVELAHRAARNAIVSIH
ncbi:hypothetical protein PLEOSDRAFT_1073060 [Pleurotus ostreatus PC15]|uniref:Uncharacterized protein n=1 Tax=Pleurotus ostreatus (strain PC15) TaxID=1137138 RepID=A0A067NX60_PLEO1|nr:hypothetical protein PLEOSDRAFT_1073060 [Pleurotus ostreatus PC15]